MWCAFCHFVAIIELKVASSVFVQKRTNEFTIYKGLDKSQSGTNQAVRYRKDYNIISYQKFIWDSYVHNIPSFILNHFSILFMVALISNGQAIVFYSDD